LILFINVIIGCIVASNVIKLHSGRIGVTSAGEGTGSTFIVDIPLFYDIHQDDNEEENFYESKSHSPDISNKPKHISTSTTIINNTSSTESDIETSKQQRIVSRSRLLIVDDALSNRKMVKRLLHTKFASMEEAENGQEALKMYEASIQEQRPFDIIMMDNFMPIMDGLDATKAIRNVYLQYTSKCTDQDVNQILPLPMIIGVTGNGIEEDIQQFRNAGADKVLVKPLNVQELWNFILVQQHWQLDV
jgi:CheY-like chemotaxis protein